MRLYLAIGVLFVSSAFAAENLMVNPHFHDDVHGWIAGGSASVEWHDVDAFDARGSGSMQVTVTGSGEVTQCVPVTGGAAYALGGRIMVPGGQPATLASIWKDAYKSADCAGTRTGLGGSSGVVDRSNGRFMPLGWRNFTVPDDARSLAIRLAVAAPEGGTVTASFDEFFLSPVGPFGVCVPNTGTLCLNNGRFEVHAVFTAPGKEPQIATAVQLTADSGYFWFFDRNNVELIVKVLDATIVNNRQWVFTAGTTNVGVSLTVYDTLTGESRAYTNPINHVYEAVLDTDAFVP